MIRDGSVRGVLFAVGHPFPLPCQVNNVVIKYVSDKYVSSMSCKMLAIEAVNSAWDPCFADYEGPTKAAFKVSHRSPARPPSAVLDCILYPLQSIRVTDVTWCLDEVSGQGKVNFGAHFSTVLKSTCV